MRWLWAIALAGVLAGCAGADYSPLQRDLQQLADLPRQMGEKLRAPPRAEPVPLPQEEKLPPPAENTAAVTAAPPAAATETEVAASAPKKPNFLEQLRTATATKNVATSPAPAPGPHDLIPEPIPVQNPLARPPWEALAEAGPNADNELDLDLLYGAGNVPAELMAEQPPEQQAEQNVAVAQQPPPLALPPEEDAEAIPQKPSGAEKTKKPEGKAEIVIKAVAVPPVTGARGEGNAELTAAMRKALKAAGWPVLNAPRKDALTVQGRVAFGKAHGANQAVKIVWDVITPDGKRLGDLKQDNAVPAGSLDQSWGENAGYAAEAAAEGIFKLIQRYR